MYACVRLCACVQSWSRGSRCNGLLSGQVVRRVSLKSGSNEERNQSDMACVAGAGGAVFTEDV